ncbi:hypothetical protein IWQ60_005582 [Tieghemiomyces parasiticus]|uniref:Uncharacterized protein n=1 Tax=Tieghemiomyces parasiticus TaxID=78921 RepID=A0A9W8ABH9_9FUNG|nr:hypothetical protein IWQ60_005582 [Tieghemiomyces parasiticus]
MLTTVFRVFSNFSKKIENCLGNSHSPKSITAEPTLPSHAATSTLTLPRLTAADLGGDFACLVAPVATVTGDTALADAARDTASSVKEVDCPVSPPTTATTITTPAESTADITDTLQSLGAKLVAGRKQLDQAQVGFEAIIKAFGQATRTPVALPPPSAQCLHTEATRRLARVPSSSSLYLPHDITPSELSRTLVTFYAKVKAHEVDLRRKQVQQAMLEVEYAEALLTHM